MFVVDCLVGLVSVALAMYGAAVAVELVLVSCRVKTIAYFGRIVRLFNPNLFTCCCS